MSLEKMASFPDRAIGNDLARPSSAIPHGDGEIFEFESFRLMPRKGLLLEDGEPVTVGGRAFDLLVKLVENAGTTVGKTELISKAWPNIFVEEGTLRVHIAALRKVLRDRQGDRRYIINVPGRGYQFAAGVTRIPPNERTALAVRDHSLSAAEPVFTTELFGRDGPISSLAAQLPRHRFITIVGPGGVGKTTVAVRIADALRASYRDGVAFVDLAPVSDPALAPSALASILGVTVSSHDIIPSLVAVLRDREMLLVLDNCEHVVDVIAILAERICQGAPLVHILATSREALRAGTEHVFSLPPLDAPPPSPEITAIEAMNFSSVKLFVDRTSARINSYVFKDVDAPAVAEICRRLDGIALSIELAAGRVDTFGARGVAARLDDRFRILTRGPRTALPHHQTLLATFDWSYLLLSEISQKVLQRLSVLPGEFLIETAVAVASDNLISATEVYDAVGALVAASLLTANTTGDAPCYRLLESTREYARAKATDSGELGPASQRQATRCLAELKKINSIFASRSSAESIRVYRTMIDGVRVALDWAFANKKSSRIGLDLTIAAVPLWTHLCLNEECRSRVEAALGVIRLSSQKDDRQVMQLFAALGTSLLYNNGGPRDATDAWSESLLAAERIGDPEFQMLALRGLWTREFGAGHIHKTVHIAKRFSKIAGIYGSAGDRLLEHRMHSMYSFYTGNMSHCRSELEATLEGHTTLLEQSGVLQFQFNQAMIVSTTLSKVLWLLGFPDKATAMMQRSVGFAEAADHELSEIYALAYGACRISIINGDFDNSRRYLNSLTRKSLLDPLGHWGLLAQCWNGVLLARQGAWSEARKALEQAIQHIPDGSFSLHHTRFLGVYAQTLARTGELSQAESAVGRAIGICEDQSERWFLPELLRIKGEIAARRDGAHSIGGAERAFHEALSLGRAQGALSWELRAAMSLAELMQGKSGLPEAWEQLRSVYGRFNEGFGTLDLRRAKSLLTSRN